MTDDFRRRRLLREWTGRIDISHLYQLQTVAGDMRRLFQGTGEPYLDYWANTILKVVSAVREEMAGYQLDQYEFSGREDEAENGDEPDPIPRLFNKLRDDKPE